MIHLELGRPGDAIRFHRRAIAIHEDLVARDPGNAHHRSDLAWAWRYLGLAMAASGDLDDGPSGWSSGPWSLYEQLVAEDLADPETRWRLARCLDEVGRIRVRTGRPPRPPGRWSGRPGSSRPWTATTPCSTASTSSAISSTWPPSDDLLGRPEEAEECICKAESVLRRPSKISPELLLFDMACGYGLWSVAGLDGAIAASEREPRARRAVSALRRAAESRPGGVELLRRDPILDPLRSRADFQEMLLDLSFPADPFCPLP